MTAKPRSIAFRFLILLACIVAGALAGFGVALLGLIGDRCAGPACAGLIIIPILAMVPGAMAGLVAGGILWFRGRRRERLAG